MNGRGGQHEGWGARWEWWRQNRESETRSDEERGGVKGEDTRQETISGGKEKMRYDGHASMSGRRGKERDTQQVVSE
jgi:hypothetical protein